MIFRVTWTDHITPGEHTIQWFVMADTKSEAITLAKKDQAAKNNIEAREWNHCMAPQHAEIPTRPILDRHARLIERAIMVHQGLPYCARCLEHLNASLEDRVERLERAVCELRDDLDRYVYPED